MMVLELKEFTNDVIATTAFGVGVDSLKQPNNEFFVMGQDVTNIPRWRFLALVLVPKLMIVFGTGYNESQGRKGHQLDDEDIVAQAVLFFLAGFDTASTLLCFICYMLATHPEVHQKLQDEVDKTLEENEGKFTYESADTPCEFFPGDYIYFPVYGLHHDPKYYPEPEKFDPKRFSDENKHKINPFTYLPFGVDSSAYV
ncbi:Cytochrome P450 9e2 [Blattella germanica]|nr:Cytochrome P450 9e2 [Blattella germanica]